MKTYRTLLIALVAWAAFVPPARAQFLIEVTASQHWGGNLYVYSALSCHGNDCMAVATGVVFLRSVDGGHTWTVRAPGLSGYTRASIIAIEQIDSLNVVAYGHFGIYPQSDSDLLVRTTDGGATWRQETVPTNQYIQGISFSNDTDGILVTGDPSHGTLITSDGGEHWDTAPFYRDYLWRCHDYGNGKYREFNINTGEIYTTRDAWTTFDSTNPIVSDPSQRSHYFYTGCGFGVGDTILAYGYHRLSPSYVSPYMARTTDDGTHWTIVYDDTTGPIGGINFLSDVKRDTILTVPYPGIALWSTDNGATWEIDSLISNDTNFDSYQNDGIGLNSEGELVGAFNGPYSPFHFALVIGRHVTSAVVQNDVSTKTRIYPNPATTSITLTGDVVGRAVHLFDLLGRDVLSGTIPGDGKLTLDVSLLPPGLYFVSDGASREKLVKE